MKTRVYWIHTEVFWYRCIFVDSIDGQEIISSLPNGPNSVNCCFLVALVRGWDLVSKILQYLLWRYIDMWPIFKDDEQMCRFHQNHLTIVLLSAEISPDVTSFISHCLSVMLKSACSSSQHDMKGVDGCRHARCSSNGNNKKTCVHEFANSAAETCKSCKKNTRSSCRWRT